MSTNRKDYYKNYKLKNKEKISEYNKNYKLNNKKKLREYNKDYLKEYRKDKKEYYLDYGKKYYLENKKNFKKYRDENKEKYAVYSKNYYQLNKEEIIKEKKIYYSKNKEKNKEYRFKNKEKINERNRAYAPGYRKEKYKNNPQFKLIVNLRNSISKLIRRNPKIIKNETTKELLGCSLDELKIHIEKQFSPGMSWDNYNNKTWHIDHIRPISLAKTMKDVISLKLMHYTNFQPLWAKDNILKSNKYNEKI
jgi:hypothetical protein